MPRLAVSLCLLVLFAGTAKAGDAPDFKGTAHVIAIVSLLGDTVDDRGGGQTSVAGAGFDELAESAMARQIAADLPGATVVKVGGPRAALMTPLYHTPGFGDPGMARLREELQQWSAGHPGVDYIAVIRKTVGMPFPRANYKFAFFGIGLAANDTPAQPNGVTPAALLNIAVLDGKTLEVVAELSARDVNWGSLDYGRNDPTPEHLPILVDDIKAMLASVTPGLVHGVGL